MGYVIASVLVIIVSLLLVGIAAFSVVYGDILAGAAMVAILVVGILAVIFLWRS